MPTLAQMKLEPPKDWSEFEDIVRDALAIRWSNPDLQRNGRHGQAQAGVDVYGEDDLRRLCGVQCRNKITLNAKEIKEEVAKAQSFKPNLDNYFFATGGSRDQQMQTELRILSDERKKQGAFLVGIFFWEDIYQDLVRNQELAAKHYPHLGPVIGSNSPLKQDILADHLRATKQLHMVWTGLTAFAHPDTTWDIVCEEMAWNLGRTGAELRGFVDDYGAVLPDSILKSIGEAIHSADHGAGGVNVVEGEPIVYDYATNAAAEVFMLLKQAIKTLRQSLFDQAGITQR